MVDRKFFKVPITLLNMISTPNFYLVSYFSSYCYCIQDITGYFTIMI